LKPSGSEQRLAAFGALGRAEISKASEPSAFIAKPNSARSLTAAAVCVVFGVT
jgi:hypothetical protein